MASKKALVLNLLSYAQVGAGGSGDYLDVGPSGIQSSDTSLDIFTSAAAGVDGTIVIGQQGAAAATNVVHFFGTATGAGIDKGTVKIHGNLEVEGTEDVIGISTFEADALFNGNVTFGDSSADSITFTGGVVTDIGFKAVTGGGGTRTVAVGAPAATQAPTALAFQAGTGGVGSNSNGAGVYLLPGAPEGTGVNYGSVYFGATGAAGSITGYQLFAHNGNGTAEPGLRWNDATSAWQYQNSGTATWYDLIPPGGLLPAGTVIDQHLQWNGGAWVAEGGTSTTDGLTLPSATAQQVIKIDDVAAGAGRDLVVQGGKTTGVGQAGGDLIMVGGQGNGVGVSGDVGVYGGPSSGATGTAGSVYVKGGIPSGGTVGNVYLGESDTGVVQFGGSAATTVNFDPAGIGTRVVSDIVFGTAGPRALRSENVTGAANAARVDIAGGDATGTGTAGAVYIHAGDSAALETPAPTVTINGGTTNAGAVKGIVALGTAKTRYVTVGTTATPVATFDIDATVADPTLYLNGRLSFNPVGGPYSTARGLLDNLNFVGDVDRSITVANSTAGSSGSKLTISSGLANGATFSGGNIEVLAPAGNTTGAGGSVVVKSGGSATGAAGDVKLLTGALSGAGTNGSVYFGYDGVSAAADAYQLLANSGVTPAGLRWNPSGTPQWEYRNDGAGAWSPLIGGGGVLPAGTLVGDHLEWGGAAWAAQADIALPSGAERTVSTKTAATGAGLQVTGGTGSAGAGGALRVKGGNGTTTGGALNLYGGNGSSAANNGEVIFGYTAIAAKINFDGPASSRVVSDLYWLDPGESQFTIGFKVAELSPGGASQLVIRGSDAGTGQGGPVQVFGGTGELGVAGNGGSGGNVAFGGGTAGATTNAGSAGGTGGMVQIVGSNGGDATTGAAGAGGQVQINAGSGGQHTAGTNGPGGDVFLNPGQTGAVGSYLTSGGSVVFGSTALTGSYTLYRDLTYTAPSQAAGPGFRLEPSTGDMQFRHGTGAAWITFGSASINNPTIPYSHLEANAAGTLWQEVSDLTLPNGADRAITVATAATAVGKNLTVSGGLGASTNGGALLLHGADAVGGNNGGYVYIWGGNSTTPANKGVVDFDRDDGVGTYVRLAGGVGLTRIMSSNTDGRSYPMLHNSVSNGHRFNFPETAVGTANGNWVRMASESGDQTLTAGKPGTGGDFEITAGMGGSTLTPNANGGKAGGTVSINGGPGGFADTVSGGAGGQVLLSGGVGGDGSAVSGSGNGGDGGLIRIAAGTGGYPLTGPGTRGNGGTLYLNGGDGLADGSVVLGETNTLEVRFGDSAPTTINFLGNASTRAASDLVFTAAVTPNVRTVRVENAAGVDPGGPLNVIAGSGTDNQDGGTISALAGGGGNNPAGAGTPGTGGDAYLTAGLAGTNLGTGAGGDAGIVYVTAHDGTNAVTLGQGGDGGDVYLQPGLEGAGAGIGTSGKRGWVIVGNSSMAESYLLFNSTYGAPDDTAGPGFRVTSTGVMQFCNGAGTWTPFGTGTAVAAGTVDYQHLRWDTTGAGSWVAETDITMPSTGARTISVATGAGAGVSLSVVAAAGAAGGNAGGALNLTAGAGTTTSAGGNVTVAGGVSPTGAAGSVYVNGGLGNGGAGNGSVYLGDSNTIGVQIGTATNGWSYINSTTLLYAFGTGNISLPNNGSARFKIEGTSVGATVTAPNLDTLTNGSDASSPTLLHYHTATGQTPASFLAVVETGVTIAAGEVVGVKNSGGVPRAFKGTATASDNTQYIQGVALATVVGDGVLQAIVITSGEVATPNAAWVGGTNPTAAQVGLPVYASETTAGRLDLTAPTTSGSTRTKVGYVTAGGSGTSKINVQVGEPVLIA